MPRSTAALTSFASGELSPRLMGRQDLSFYANGAEEMQNFMALPHGPAERRPGTRFVAETKDSSKASRLLPFEFSVTQAYALEAGDKYFRFFKDQGQIVVADTDAAVANGTFDSDITDWDDRSTGAAAISHAILGTVDEGTWGVSPSSTVTFGDASALCKSEGLLFLNATAGTVSRVRIKTASTHIASDNVVAGIYEDNSGAVGTQVGSDSSSVLVNAASTEFTFTWGTAPSLSAATNYWLVLTDTGGALNSSLELVADQGPAWATGRHDTITSITDGSGSHPAGDLRAEILVQTGAAEGALALDGASGETAWGEQDITTTATGTEHVLMFRVRGIVGDTVQLSIGTTSTGTDLIDDLDCAVGYHAIAFTPTASPFYVQFKNTAAKTVHIDDVSLIDNAAMEIATPYAEADLFDLKWTQSADVLYLVAAGYRPYKLSRRGHTTWQLEEINFIDGPYLSENTDTAKTLTPAATTGLGVTVTASGHAPFVAGDVGRLLYLDQSSNKGYGVIVEFEATDEVKIDIRSDFSSTAATSAWRLGVWSDALGWPAAVIFHEERLMFGGATENPSRIDGSKSGDFETFTPGANDDDPVAYTIANNTVSAVKWFASQEKLHCGTLGMEGVIAADTLDNPITPSNIEIKKQSGHGSADLLPVEAGAAVLFVQRHAKKLREITFSIEKDKFVAADRTLRADHITGAGLVDITYQQEPWSMVWTARADGVLLGFTYLEDEQVFAWHRHPLGGTAAKAEAVACIPGASEDELWLITSRTINGGTKRYVEFLEAGFPVSGGDIKDAFYIDSGLTYSGASTTTLTGLGHLEGETVQILSEGSVMADKTVSGGAITLDRATTKAQVGLKISGRLKTVPIEGGAREGVSQGKARQFDAVTVRFLNTLGAEIGQDGGSMEPATSRSGQDLMDSAVPLVSDDKLVRFSGDFDTRGQILITTDVPLPCTVVGLYPRQRVNEG
jgi:hypothetical protein